MGLGVLWVLEVLGALGFIREKDQNRKRMLSLAKVEAFLGSANLGIYGFKAA